MGSMGSKGAKSEEGKNGVAMAYTKDERVKRGGPWDYPGIKSGRKARPEGQGETPR